jgi:2-C-methyl-D-erythritol 4-phosphate cytidylyltransferase / 2-C-methyl-D-erythritol 2,4-cyclodiphosphate synthase
MTAAIIVGAGRGRRMGGPIPKQYRNLDNIPIIRHTLLAFLRHPEVSQVQTVIHPADLDLYEEATAGLSLPPPVIGGNTRQESVRFGLESVAAQPPDKVIIHDAVRPFVEQETISAVIAALDNVPAVVTGLSVPDTLKRCVNGIIEETIDRTNTWRAQTPQGFHFEKILKAHEEIHYRDPIHVDLTDDSLVIEKYGLKVAIIEGSEDNFKITTERDLQRAELILQRGRQENHVGWGFDFHAFSPGDHLVMCGIPIPHSQGIARSHNADVPLNAVTDALLGTVGGTQSETHFQPDMPGFRGKTSDFFVRRAVSLVSMKAGRIVHVDLTILTAAPDITPLHETMIIRLASLLSISPSRISIKQVATYQAGFYGRADGIGAQCLVTTQFPAL